MTTSNDDTSNEAPEHPLEAAGAASRWTDNPFRDPNATPEQLEWLKKRDKAINVYQATGDSVMAEDIGLFPKQPRRRYEYGGRVFHVVRTSRDSAFIGLSCSMHSHKICQIGLTEDELELLVGQTGVGAPKYRVYSVSEALEKGAELILADCTTVQQLEDQLNDFFWGAGELDERVASQGAAIERLDEMLGAHTDVPSLYEELTHRELEGLPEEHSLISIVTDLCIRMDAIENNDDGQE